MGRDHYPPTATTSAPPARIMYMLGNRIVGEIQREGGGRVVATVTRRYYNGPECSEVLRYMFGSKTIKIVQCITSYKDPEYVLKTSVQLGSIDYTDERYALMTVNNNNNDDDDEW